MALSSPAPWEWGDITFVKIVTDLNMGPQCFGCDLESSDRCVFAGQARHGGLGRVTFVVSCGLLGKTEVTDCQQHMAASPSMHCFGVVDSPMSHKAHTMCSDDSRSLLKY